MVRGAVPLLLSVLVLAVAPPVGAAGAGRSAALRPRVPIAKPATVSRPSPDSYLTVKFRDDLRARATDGAIVFSAGRRIDPLRVVADEYGLTFAPLVRLPADKLAALEARAAARSGRAQPDLAGMFVVRGPEVRLEQAASDLLALDVVEWVDFVVRMPEPPCTDLPPATPDLFAQQTYHSANPGLNVAHMWGLGARGQGIEIADCEYAYILGTEDLCGITNEPGQTFRPDVIALGWDDHGTAVLGMLVGIDNTYGIKGIAPDAAASFFPEASVEEGEDRRLTAVTNAIASVGAGDVVLLEMQTIGGGSGYGPAELDLGVWNATRTGVDAGVVVVAAAGNGNQDLDSATYDDYRARGDSGAIVVGAGTYTTAHAKLGTSTFGSRVNLQGWGAAVFTAGYGDFFQLGGDKRQRYTDTFDGTSSASAMVAGGVALLQSYSEQVHGCRLEPGAARQLLIDTGFPQLGAGGHIGPFPDLASAAADLLAQGDCTWPYCGNGVQEGEEECDGSDGGCTGPCMSDCTCPPSTPGEATDLRVVSWNAPNLTITYTPACASTDHSIVYGKLEKLGTAFPYFNQYCSIGESGSYGPFPVGAGARFFLVAGHDGNGSEGSYGTRSNGAQRPEFDADSCGLVQDLSAECSP